MPISKVMNEKRSGVALNPRPLLVSEGLINEICNAFDMKSDNFGAAILKRLKKF